MRTTALWMVAVLGAAALGAFAGSAWRDRATPPRPAPPSAASSARPQEVPPQLPPAGDPFLQMEGTTLSTADPAGHRLWELRAAQLSVDNAKQRVVLTRMSGQLYSRGTVQVTFTAPHAVFHVTSRDVEMTGGVVGRAADGRTLRASRVRWAAGQRVIQAAGTVVLTQQGVVIHADSLTTDAALDQVRFSGRVLVRVTE